MSVELRPIEYEPANGRNVSCYMCFPEHDADWISPNKQLPIRDSLGVCDKVFQRLVAQGKAVSLAGRP